MSINGEQRIRGFDGSMLSRIAGKYDPRFPFSGEAQKFRHLASADLTSLVHDYNCPFHKFAFDEESRYRSGRRETRLFHFHHLLSLRRERDNVPPRVCKLTDQFLENKALSCPRATTKHGDSVDRGKQSSECLALFAVQLRIHRKWVYNQWMAFSDAFLCGLNDFPFT